MKFQHESGSTLIAGAIISALLTTLGVPVATAATPPKPAANTCVVANDEAIADLFRRWNLALASLDSSRVAALYWPNAVLLPTVSNVPRTDTASIKDYFVHFLQKYPRGQIVKRITHHGCNVSVDAGLYDFSVMDPSGNASVVSARYTFVYTYRDGVWKIQHHHSSAMPEPVGAPPAAHEAAHDDTHDEAPTLEKSTAEKASAEKKTLNTADAPPEEGAMRPSTPPRARIQLESAPRTPTSYLNVEQRRKVGRETVGLKVCATRADAGRSFEISDAAPHAEANDAALSWAKAARWSVTGTPSAEDPVCAQVVVRFTDAGT